MIRAGFASLLLLLIGSTGFTPAADAKAFATSYLAMSIPDTWTCQQMLSNWACTPQAASQLHLATLVMSAKEAGPDDNLPALKRLLSQPRSITGQRRLPLTSKFESATDGSIAGQNWSEVIHLNSEIEGFRTHYLISVYNGLSVLLSFSYDQKQAAQFLPIWSQIKSTLQTKAPPRAPQPQASGGLGAVTPHADHEGIAAPAAPAGPRPLPTKWIILGAVAVALILYLLLGR